jgi:hypothetical protein
MATLTLHCMTRIAVLSKAEVMTITCQNVLATNPRTLKSWKSHGVTSDEGNGVLGRELVGEVGRLFTELFRFRMLRDDCVSSRN